MYFIVEIGQVSDSLTTQCLGKDIFVQFSFLLVKIDRNVSSCTDFGKKKSCMAELKFFTSLMADFHPSVKGLAPLQKLLVSGKFKFLMYLHTKVLVA